jgi:hypothetical protein
MRAKTTSGRSFRRLVTRVAYNHDGAFMKKSQHVVPRTEGGWAVRKTGAARASKVFANQQEAVKYAKEVAQKEGGAMYIHRSDGTIRDRSSYGNEPHPPKG